MGMWMCKTETMDLKRLKDICFTCSWNLIQDNILDIAVA